MFTALDKAIIKKCLLIAALWQFCNCAFSNESAIRNLQEKLNNYHFVQANFTQVILDTDGSILQKSSGVMRVSNSGYASWIFETPVKQEFLLNGDRLFFYDKNLKQVVVKNLKQNSYDLPISFLMIRKNKLSDHFFVTENTKKKMENKKYTSSVFEIIPKNVTDIDTKINAHFEGNKISTLSFKNPLSQNIRINFYNFEIKAKFNSEIFSPNRFPKKDTDWIYQ